MEELALEHHLQDGGAPAQMRPSLNMRNTTAVIFCPVMPTLKVN